jgi:putative flippase GtrA
VVAYLDVDLSTDLDALLPLVAPLLSGHSDVAIGTRLAQASRVVRGPKREAISRSYNLLLRTMLRSGFSDAQCGFKAVRTDVARVLLPLVEDEGWFFDTELLVLAEHNGLRIHEVPVDWVDDPDSRVDVVGTARDDLHGIWRMLRRTTSGEVDIDAPVGLSARDRVDDPVRSPDVASQLVRFASIGVVSTIVFALLFVLLAAPLGYVLADIVALGVCTVANTAANRRLTFSLRGRAGLARHHLAGLALAALPLGLTLATIAVLDTLGVTALVPVLVAVTAANLVASVARFVVLRRWVFAKTDPPVDPDPPVSTSAAAAPGAAGALVRRVRQLLRYGGVSLVSTTVSLSVLGLLVYFDVLPAAWANIVATMVGMVPSFELNRRWVWNKTGPRSVVSEILPFGVLSFAGLGLSTLAVAVTASWAASSGLEPGLRTLAVELANLAAFGTVWVVQFVILDRVLFRHRPSVA